MYLDIHEEARELRGHFPDLTASDFYRLDNDNIGVPVTYTTDGFLQSDYEVLIEYPRGYPDSQPKAWVQSPDLEAGAPHTLGGEYGDTRICYLQFSQWESDYTGYDAAGMIKTWLYAYSNWKETGNWDWGEAD